MQVHLATKPAARLSFILLLLCIWSKPISAGIIFPPTSLNTTLGLVGGASFTCTASGAQNIFWNINGLAATLDDDNIDTALKLVNPENSTQLGTLTVPSQLQYNQSSITCNAVQLDFTIASSKPVLFLIQGVLEAVSNISVEVGGSSTLVNVDWVPPYSLDNVPISNYTLTLSGSEFGYTTSYVSTNPALSFHLPDLCDVYTLTVSANNEAGYGKNKTAIVYELEATQILPESVQVMLFVPNGGVEPEVLVEFNVTHDCDIPLTHTISVSLTDSDVLWYGPIETNSSNELITLTVDKLLSDTFYHIAVKDETVGGESNEVFIDISSYDVQSAKVTVDGEGVLCVSCSFLTGSLAGGCVAELSATGELVDYTSVHLSRVTNEHTITGCVQNLPEGEYCVKIYDLEKEGFKLSTAMPAIVMEGVVVAKKRVTPSSTITTSTTETLNIPTRGKTSSTSLAPTQAVNGRDPATVANAKANANNITYRNSAIGVGVVIIVVIVILFTLIIIQLTKLRRRKRLNIGTVARNKPDTTHLQTQRSSDTTVTTISSFASLSPFTENVSSDVEAPPPPPPPPQEITILPLSTVTPTHTTGSSSDEDTSPRSSVLPSSPGAESTRSLLRAETRTLSSRPSSYHGPPVTHPTAHEIHQRAPNRMRTTSLRSNGAMTAWAAVNPLTLPILPEAPTPYYEIHKDSTHRPHSTIILSSSRNSTDYSNQDLSHPRPHPIEYVSLQFSSSHHELSTRDHTHREHSPPNGSVQYAIISNNNTYVSHDRLSDCVRNSLV